MRSGKVLRSVTIAPAPTRHCLPITAPFITTAWMPISEPSPIVQPCSIDLVADRDVVADLQRIARVGMQHRAFLDVAFVADRDRLVVAAGDRAEPDAGALAERDLADQRRFGRDIGRSRDLGRVLAQTVEGHG